MLVGGGAWMPRVEFVGAGGARDFSGCEEESGHQEESDVPLLASFVRHALDGRWRGHAVYSGTAGA